MKFIKLIDDYKFSTEITVSLLWFWLLVHSICDLNLIARWSNVRKSFWFSYDMQSNFSNFVNERNMRINFQKHAHWLIAPNFEIFPLSMLVFISMNKKKRPLLSKYCLKIEKHPEPLSVVPNVKESISANKTNNLPRSSKQEKNDIPATTMPAVQTICRFFPLPLFVWSLFFYSLLCKKWWIPNETKREEQKECTSAQWKDLI